MSDSELDAESSRKWRVIWLLALATMFSMSLWFSATAVQHRIQEKLSIGDHQIAWLTISVQLGFVAGALCLAAANVSDRFPPRVVFFLGSTLGSLFNLCLLSDSLSWEGMLACRAATGFCCAAIYPVGMKIMSTWTLRDRGTAIGILVGALVIGSASPHLLSGLGRVEDWKFVIAGVSGLAMIGGSIGLFAGSQGPHQAKGVPLRWRRMGDALKVTSLRRANLGYLGHMWELYATWAWLPVFLAASFAQWNDDGEWSVESMQRWSALLAFAAIGIGGLTSWCAGLIADRLGRTTVTIASLIVSGICCLTIGLTYGQQPWLVAVVALIWGAAVVCDSAQFSSSVSELADRQYIGTQLTMQTAMGFLLSTATLQLIPISLHLLGWRWAFAPLALGPAVGVYSMWRLRQSEDAKRLASGNR